MDILWYIVYAIIVVFISRCFATRLYDYYHYNYPPGPRSWPIVGNVLNVKMKYLNNSLWDHKEKYGDISHFTIAGKHFVVLNSVQAVREAMESEHYKDIFAARPESFFAKYVRKNTMGLESYSEKTKMMRTFVHTGIKSYGAGLTDIEANVLNELRFMNEVLHKQNDAPFDIYECISQSVSNVIYIMMMGKRFDYNHEIHEFQRSLNIGTVKMLNPSVNGILTKFPFLSYFPFGLGKLYRDTVNGLNGVLRYVYDDILNGKFENIDIEERHGIVYDSIKQQREHAWFTSSKVRGLLSDLVSAGVITTTNTLYILILVLLHKPNIQKKLQKEIDDVVGIDRKPRLADQDSLPFTRAIILEVLRFSAHTPMLIPHSTITDVTFRGYNLKKDTVVLVNSWKIHHDKDLWEDPWEFKPQRFLDEYGNLLPVENERRRNFMMFGRGKRSCPARNFALTRIFLFVTHFFQHFTVYNDDMDSTPSMDPHTFLPYFVRCPPSYKIQLAIRETQ